QPGPSAERTGLRTRQRLAYRPLGRLASPAEAAAEPERGPEVERAGLVRVLAVDRLDERREELDPARDLGRGPEAEVEIVGARRAVVRAEEVRDREHVLEVETSVRDLPGAERPEAQAVEDRVAELEVDVAPVEPVHVGHDLLHEAVEVAQVRVGLRQEG